MIAGTVSGTSGVEISAEGDNLEVTREVNGDDSKEGVSTGSGGAVADGGGADRAVQQEMLVEVHGMLSVRLEEQHRESDGSVLVKAVHVVDGILSIGNNKYLPLLGGVVVFKGDQNLNLEAAAEKTRHLFPGTETAQAGKDAAVGEAASKMNPSADANEDRQVRGSHAKDEGAPTSDTERNEQSQQSGVFFCSGLALWLMMHPQKLPIRSRRPTAQTRAPVKIRRVILSQPSSPIKCSPRSFQKLRRSLQLQKWWKTRRWLRRSKTFLNSQKRATTIHQQQLSKQKADLPILSWIRAATTKISGEVCVSPSRLRR